MLINDFKRSELIRVRRYIVNTSAAKLDYRSSSKLIKQVDHDQLKKLCDN